MRYVPLICIIAALALYCSSTEKKTTHGYICMDHLLHHIDNRQQYLQCAGINSQDMDQYITLEETGRTKDYNQINPVAKGLQKTLEHTIVRIMKESIETAIQKGFLQLGSINFQIRWEFEKMTLPVIFRKFRSYDGNFYNVKAVALIKKDDLTPKSIIQYLPLDYKMHILKKEKRKIPVYNP